MTGREVILFVWGVFMTMVVVAMAVVVRDHSLFLMTLGWR